MEGLAGVPSGASEERYDKRVKRGERREKKGVLVGR